jgi:hypothetical protein
MKKTKLRFVESQDALVELLHQIKINGKFDKQISCYFIGDTELKLCVPNFLEIYEDPATKTIHILDGAPKTMFPRTKPPLKNAFYVACNKTFTKINPLLILKSVLS